MFSRGSRLEPEGLRLSDSAPYMRKVETIQAALNILRSLADRKHPVEADIQLLRQAKGVEAERMSTDELACTVVQQYLEDMKRAKSQGA